MILVDANLILYAIDSSSPMHEKAVLWWNRSLSGSSPVCLSWTVILAFIRIATNARIFDKPLSLDQALSYVNDWLAQPCVRIIGPTVSHWEVFQRLLKSGQAVANLTTDAHLAAIAIEHGCTMMSTDSDFMRFKGLKWENPLA